LALMSTSHNSRTKGPGAMARCRSFPAHLIVVVRYSDLCPLLTRRRQITPRTGSTCQNDFATLPPSLPRLANSVVDVSTRGNECCVRKKIEFASLPGKQAAVDTVLLPCTHRDRFSLICPPNHLAVCGGLEKSWQICGESTEMLLNITSLVARTNMATSPGGPRRNHCDGVSADLPALGSSGLAKSGSGSPHR
jgi:hypothetical protein